MTYWRSLSRYARAVLVSCLLSAVIIIVMATMDGGWRVTLIVALVVANTAHVAYQAVHDQ